MDQVRKVVSFTRAEELAALRKALRVALPGYDGDVDAVALRVQQELDQEAEQAFRPASGEKERPLHLALNEAFQP